MGLTIIQVSLIQAEERVLSNRGFNSFDFLFYRESLLEIRKIHQQPMNEKKISCIELNFFIKCMKTIFNSLCVSK